MIPPNAPGSQHSELPQTLAQVFQLHYETALGRPQASKGPGQPGSGVPLRSQDSPTPASSADQSCLSAALGCPQRPSPLPALFSPVGVSHALLGSGPNGAGPLPGTLVWPPMGASPSQPAPSAATPASLNFPQFRVKSVLSSDSGVSGSFHAEQRPPQQVPSTLKRPAAAPLPERKPKKRGRPSRKDKAEAAAAAAAAARDASLARLADKSQKLIGIHPKASWRQEDCGAEIAPATLQQQQQNATPTPAKMPPSPAPVHAAVTYSGISSAVFSGIQAPSSENNLGFVDLRLRGAPGGPIQGASSASCLADSASNCVRIGDSGVPAVGNPADEGSMGNAGPQGIAVPVPESVPALDWLMGKLTQQASGRTAASLLRSCHDQVGESRLPRWGQNLPQSASSGMGSSHSLHQLSSAGAFSSSRQSKPPASVVAAASALLARHGGLDSRLEMLPTVSSVKGRVLAPPCFPEAVTPLNLLHEADDGPGFRTGAMKADECVEESEESRDRVEMKGEIDLVLRL